MVRRKGNFRLNENRRGVRHFSSFYLLQRDDRDSTRLKYSVRNNEPSALLLYFYC